MQIESEIIFIIYTGFITSLGFLSSRKKISLMFLVVALGILVGWLLKVPMYGIEAIYTLMTLCGIIIAYYFILRERGGPSED